MSSFLSFMAAPRKPFGSGTTHHADGEHNRNSMLKEQAADYLLVDFKHSAHEAKREFAHSKNDGGSHFAN